MHLAAADASLATGNSPPERTRDASSAMSPQTIAATHDGPRRHPARMAFIDALARLASHPPPAQARRWPVIAARSAHRSSWGGMGGGMGAARGRHGGGTGAAWGASMTRVKTL